jgi:hypothetical protein
MTKRNLHLIGFVLTIFSSVLISSCGEDKVTAKSTQPASLSYHEEFDSMQRVIDRGWRGVNLSDPLGGDSWQQGSFVADNVKGGPFFSSISSHSYKASANEHAFVPYTAGADLSFINCWLITPELSMKNGDIISFWTTTADPVSFPDRMQVWLNPTSNSYNVGRSAAETGDFTVKLLDINPNLSPTAYPVGYPTTWTKFEIVISGLPNGTIPQKHRVGFRYYVKDGGPNGGVSNEIGIDDFDFLSQ